MFKIELADSFFTRLKGLMFRKSISDEAALLLKDTNRVHTSFMKFTIGVHYLDEDFNVIDYELLKPWKLGKKVRGTKHIVETSENVKAYDEDLIKTIYKMGGK